MVTSSISFGLMLSMIMFGTFSAMRRLSASAYVLNLLSSVSILVLVIEILYLDLVIFSRVMILYVVVSIVGRGIFSVGVFGRFEVSIRSGRFAVKKKLDEPDATLYNEKQSSNFVLP